MTHLVLNDQTVRQVLVEAVRSSNGQNISTVLVQAAEGLSKASVGLELSKPVNSDEEVVDGDDSGIDRNLIAFIVGVIIALIVLIFSVTT